MTLIFSTQKQAQFNMAIFVLDTYRARAEAGAMWSTADIQRLADVFVTATGRTRYFPGLLLELNEILRSFDLANAFLTEATEARAVLLAKLGPWLEKIEAHEAVGYGLSAELTA